MAGDEDEDEWMSSNSKRQRKQKFLPHDGDGIMGGSDQNMCKRGGRQVRHLSMKGKECAGGCERGREVTGGDVRVT